MQFDFPALGTHWWVEVWDETNAQTADEAERFVRQFVSEFEKRYSRFLPNSEITSLNRDQTLASPSADTRALLSYSIDLYRRTRGVFNVMVGHILEARGYDAAYSLTDKGSADLQPGNPLTDLIIGEDAIELRYGNVDVGGYGKGWCIDRLADALRDQFGLQQFLINGGGDIYVTHQDNQPVEIHLEDPQTKQIIGSTHIMNQGFAASSPHKRAWPTAAGTQQTHIVTKSPQTTITTKDIIYLTASTAVEADAFATTLLQVDDDTARRLAEENDLTIL